MKRHFLSVSLATLIATTPAPNTLVDRNPNVINVTNGIHVTMKMNMTLKKYIAKVRVRPSTAGKSLRYQTSKQINVTKITGGMTMEHRLTLKKCRNRSCEPAMVFPTVCSFNIQT